MKCNYAKETTTKIPYIGGSTILKIVECSLKKRSEVDRIRIYNTLHAKELEGSIVNDSCPVAKNENWEDCPYFKTIK